MYTREKLKPNKKNEMTIKENKETKSIKLENKNYKELGYESGLCKESRFKTFNGLNVVNRWSEYVGVIFSWKARIAMKKYCCNASSVFLKMSGMILSILSRRFCLSLLNLGRWRKKWFNVSISKPQITNRIKCV